MQKFSPSKHIERAKRALLSLTGLSVGDSFGECFFTESELGHIASPGPLKDIANRTIPTAHLKPPRKYTDDTEMALGILEVLFRHKTIQQDELARVFARNYVLYGLPNRRSYGGAAHGLLREIFMGGDWKVLSPRLFQGGSMGNGGGMRSAPLGAYFADDIPKLIEEARKSAQVTHYHPEGQAGAIAVALAAAWAANRKNKEDGKSMLQFVIQNTPKSAVRAGIEKTLKFTDKTTVEEAVKIVGNGSNVLAQDTIPFALWCASCHLDNYTEALWKTVSGLGDRDTTCAIVGGIVALSAGRNSIPEEWIKAREPLKIKEWDVLPSVLEKMDIFDRNPKQHKIQLF